MMTAIMTDATKSFRCLRKWLLSGLITMGLLLCSGKIYAQTESPLEFDASRHGPLLKQAFQELLPQVNHYAVQVIVNEKTTVPGTLIDRDSCWVVAKASELQEYLSEEDIFEIKFSGQEPVSAEFLGYDQSLDLVYLTFERQPETNIPLVKIADEVLAGQWVITVGFEQDLPLGIGVYGADPREIESGKGYVGLNVEEADEGLKVTQIMAKSGAANAGFRKGDILLKEDQTPAEKRSWLTKWLAAYEPGDWCALTVLRDGEPLLLDMRIGVSWDNLIERQALMNRFGSDVSQRRSGFRSVFQHDTLLHPRYCGSPVVNLRGELTGVNIARAGRTDTLAIPINVILETAEELSEQ